jgi:hypothetical protein
MNWPVLFVQDVALVRFKLARYDQEFECGSSC